MEQVKAMLPLDDPSASLPFIQETLSAIRSEIDSETALLGFVGTPWTLAAYAIEGKAERHCFNTKARISSEHALRQHHRQVPERLVTGAHTYLESSARPSCALSPR